MPSQFQTKHPKYRYPSSFWSLSKPEQIWGGYLSFSFSSSSFLYLIHLSLLFLLIHLPLFAFPTKALLCSISETLFLSVIGMVFCDYYSYPLKNSWKMGTDCCGWDGVTCDTMIGHVTGVDLTCSELQGPIHPNSTFFSLCHL